MDLPDAWIETTSYREEGRTLWMIKLGGEVLKVGEVNADPSGAHAYETATAWATANARGTVFAWKHWQGAFRENES